MGVETPREILTVIITAVSDDDERTQLPLQFTLSSGHASDT